jgi:hypothetical protein
MGRGFGDLGGFLEVEHKGKLRRKVLCGKGLSDFLKLKVFHVNVPREV